MTRAFISALGALRANQDWMDLIGNNLANSNTLGFKASRALFADQMHVTLRAAAAPGSTVGGRNPMQVGLGTRLGAIDRNLSQGALSLTGRTFDLAMQGRGFFGLQVGDSTFYTRVGTFGLDSNFDMVDLRTGYHVLDQQGQPLSLDVDAVDPPKATTSLVLNGNLPAEVTGPLAEQLTSASSFLAGSKASLTGASTGPWPVPVGETWTFELTMNDGAPEQVAVTSATGTISTADVVAAIDALDHVTAVDVGGAVQLTSDKKGTSSSIKVTPGAAGKDLAGLVGLSTALVSGSETPATGATDLNDLASNTAGYAAGDTIEFSGTDADGSPVAASFVYGTDGTTVADLASFLDAQYAGATVSFDPLAQTLSLEADGTGEASLSMVLVDGDNQAGATDWTQHVMALTTNGMGPDTAKTSMEVFDQAGNAHQVSFEFAREADGSWTLTPSVDPDAGTVTSAPISGIVFNPDGSILSPPTIGVTVQFQGQGAQNLVLELGSPGGFDGITQFGGPASVLAVEQDGYGAGELASMQVLADGVIEGYFTNGQTKTMGSFGVATFDNERGLEEIGDSLWSETPNSGDRSFGAAFQGVAGEVVGGALEESNVDTAEQFVRLIQAQRGFQSNARVITVQDEMMSEANNML